jgi:hypothetical protein
VLKGLYDAQFDARLLGWKLTSFRVRDCIVPLGPGTEVATWIHSKKPR